MKFSILRISPGSVLDRLANKVGIVDCPEIFLVMMIAGGPTSSDSRKNSPPTLKRCIGA